MWIIFSSLEENFEEELVPLSHQLGRVARVQPSNVQGMKTSILYDDEDDYAPSPRTINKSQQLFSNKSIFSSTYINPKKNITSPFPKMDTTKPTVEQNKLNASLFQPFSTDDSPLDRSTKMQKKTHLFKSGIGLQQSILNAGKNLLDKNSS